MRVMVKASAIGRLAIRPKLRARSRTRFSVPAGLVIWLLCLLMAVTFFFDGVRDVNEEVGFEALAVEQRVRVVGFDAGMGQFGQEVMVPGVDDALERRVADGPVIGVLVVGAVGVVGDDGVGLVVADKKGELVAERPVVLELAVAVA